MPVYLGGGRDSAEKRETRTHTRIALAPHAYMHHASMHTTSLSLSLRECCGAWCMCVLESWFAIHCYLRGLFEYILYERTQRTDNKHRDAYDVCILYIFFTNLERVVVVLLFCFWGLLVGHICWWYRIQSHMFSSRKDPAFYVDILHNTK